MNTNTFIEKFKNIPDFRQEGKVKHKLIDIMFTSVVATIANANTWIEVETFVEAKEEWFKQFIELENGVPSHDTYERIFENIDANEFNSSFMNWANEISHKSEGRIVAIDGKTSRRSHDKKINKKAIHIVNAWVDENDLILGQLKTAGKSNEITAIPELIDLLFLEGAIVTIDAAGTQKNIVEKIINKKANYVLALKGNHGIFHKEVQDFFEYAKNNNFEDIDYSKKVTLEKGHGRIEKREYIQTDDIDWFADKGLWCGLKSIGMVKRTVTIKENTTVEVFYYISSLETPKEGECDLFAKAIRKHWGVESCHWILNVVFREDHSRVRKNNGAINQSMLKKIALNILKTETITKKKTSLKLKRFKASIDESFLSKLILNL